MIVKNISATIQSFSELDGLQLLPGAQQDISSFSQKQRDNCFDLQDAFRKGELICIGVGVHDRPDVDPKMRVARARFMEKLENDPLIDRDQISYEDETHEDRRTGVTIVDQPAPSLITKNQHGATEVHHFDPPEPPAPPPPPPSAPKIEHPTITPERAREILSKKCIGTKTNGRACKRWACKGFEYCSMHMPEDLRVKYKEMKTKEFLD